MRFPWGRSKEGGSQQVEAEVPKISEVEALAREILSDPVLRVDLDEIPPETKTSESTSIKRGVRFRWQENGQSFQAYVAELKGNNSAIDWDNVLVEVFGTQMVEKTDEQGDRNWSSASERLFSNKQEDADEQYGKDVLKRIIRSIDKSKNEPLDLSGRSRRQLRQSGGVKPEARYQDSKPFDQFDEKVIGARELDARENEVKMAKFKLLFDFSKAGSIPELNLMSTRNFMDTSFNKKRE